MIPIGGKNSPLVSHISACPMNKSTDHSLLQTLFKDSCKNNSLGREQQDCPLQQKSVHLKLRAPVMHPTRSAGIIQATSCHPIIGKAQETGEKY